MQIHALTLPLSSNYPTPAQVGLVRQPPIVPPCKDTNAECQPAIVQKEAVRLAPDRRPQRDAQPLYDQQLSHRGHRAQQLYTSIEYASDLELMSRIDVVI